MSLRKKRLFLIVAGVILCCVIVWFMSEYAMKSDREEYARRCKYFEGIWSDNERQMTVEIHRVSSGNLLFSIYDHRYVRNIKLVRAYAVGDDMYEFTYGVESGRKGRIYKVKPGVEAKGTIHLQEDKLKVDIPEIPGKRMGMGFRGVMTSKKELASQTVYHLEEYLGSKKEMPKELGNYCSFGYDAAGKIWRVHAMLAEDNEIYKTDIVGINMNSLEEECEEQLGELVSEIDLGDRGSRRQYENDQYVSTVIVNFYGIITELDCQLANLPGITREGDFLMQGDTLYRYAGDYSQEKTIEIPRRTRKIASHAFDAGEHGYSLRRQERITCNIDIPSKVKVEREAFANCGSLNIYLKSGWKEIPEGAFAHTVSLESISRKNNWVTFVLPSTIQKIGDNAFALGDSTETLDQYWQDVTETRAVSVQASGFSTWSTNYIGDNAFWGIMMSELPKGLKYLGKNYTIKGDEVKIPSGMKTLREDSLYMFDECRVVFTGDIEDIEDDSVRGNMYYFSVSENAKNIKRGNEALCEWIVSKDEKVLFSIRSIEDNNYDGLFYDDYYYDSYEDLDFEDYVDEDGEIDAEVVLAHIQRKKKKTNYQLDKKGNMILKIPEGIEEIRSYANMNSCDKIIVPKSVKRISVEAFLRYGMWHEVVFKGDVPEFYGRLPVDDDRTPVDEDYVAKFRVRKGQKKKMIKQLQKLYPGIKKEELARCITIF